MDINKRFKELRKAFGLSQAELGSKIGLSKSGISNIESGTRNVTDKHIKLICSELPIDENWLRTGAGKMRRKTPFDTMEQLKKEFDLDDFSLDLVHEYLKLNPTQRKTVRDFVYLFIRPEENKDYLTEIPKTSTEQEENKHSSSHPITESEQEATTKELETEYKKSRLKPVRKTESSVLNTTKGTESQKTS